MPNIYAEFENRTMLQLAYQYQQVVTAAERREADEALNALQVLSDEANKYYLREVDREFTNDAEVNSFVKEVQQTLQSNSLPGEWRTPTGDQEMSTYTLSWCRPLAIAGKARHTLVKRTPRPQ